ncbi:MAG: MerR family transcriptional regulator [Aliidongia sp.]
MAALEPPLADRIADEPDGSRRPAKSATAFRTISEVADELQVPQHVLRFWESKFPQIRPLKRGGGRRYYRPEDVVLLRRVAQLLYQEGYTIKGVQRLLREGRIKPARPTETEALPTGLAAETEPAPARPETPLSLAPTAPITDPAARTLLRAILEELEDLRDLLPRKPR